MRRIQIFLQTLALLLTIASIAYAQSDTILPNPKAVALHRAWTVQGKNSSDRVGLGAGTVSDINGDSINDVAIMFHKVLQWKVFLGGAPAPNTEPVWTLDSAGDILLHPLLADFFANGHKNVVFERYRHETIQGIPHVFSIISLFQVDSGHLPTTASQTTKHERLIDVKVSNLDGQPGDELLIAQQDSTGSAEIWIYHGGQDFQVQTPTAVMYDNEIVENPSITLGDLDGDHKPDLILAGAFKTGIKLKFYFSDENSPWSWATRKPDREITMANRVIGLNAPLRGAYDLDGDSVLDLAGITYGGGDNGGSFLYLSGSGKNARTRSFTLDDADIFFKSSRYLASPINWGYINDSLRRYKMMTLGGSTDGGYPLSLGFSGGPHGPDGINKAYYSDYEDVFGWASGDVGDVTGDGWDDVLAASPFYGALPNQGIAMILAGGPYIPQDPALGVQEVAVAGKSNGLSLWPNPVHDELNIAWRGDLKQMPTRFEVYDINGRRVADGTVEPYLGAALWHCTDVPAGTYLLTAFDHNGAVIATTKILKQ